MSSSQKERKRLLEHTRSLYLSTFVHDDRNPYDKHMSWRNISTNRTKKRENIRITS